MISERSAKKREKRGKKRQKGPFFGILGGSRKKAPPPFGLRMTYSGQDALFCAKFRPKQRYLC
jgi:hypothetical protein